jgi:AraC-like DNA-binding protein
MMEVHSVIPVYLEDLPIQFDAWISNPAFRVPTGPDRSERGNCLREAWSEKFTAALLRKGERGNCLREAWVFARDEDIRVQIHPLNAYGADHTHDFFELTYVFAGEFTQIIDKECITQTTDQLVMLRPGAWHTVSTESRNDYVFNILLRRATVKRSLLQFVSPKNPLYRFLFEGADLKPDAANYLVFSGIKTQRAILDKLVVEFQNKGPESRQLVMAHVVMLFAELARTTYVEPVAEGPKDYLIADILAFIAHNFRTTTQAQVAEHFYYSPAHLSRVLTAATGKSFPSIVNGHKIDAVLSRLATGDPMWRLVRDAGFTSTDYFYRAFQRERGISFAEFRRTIKG